MAIDPIGRTRPSHLKLSVAAYSYRDYLPHPKNPQPKMDLFDFVNLAVLPMFLFSGAFYPLSLYPDKVRYLIEALPGLVDSVSVGKPTLEDVFIQLAGRRLAEDQ